MELKLIHTLHDAVEVSHGSSQLFRYVYEPTTPKVETPKPYFHPLRSLSGELLTNHRPHDHLWHHGLAMTLTHVSGQNFWGGASFVRDQGYVNLDNDGQIKHQSWEKLECGSKGVEMQEKLNWITFAGETWFEEKRGIQVDAVNKNEGWWSLRFSTRLKNVSGKELEIGSPTTSGRPMAGYGGLMWRGPRSFLNCEILAAEGLQGQEIMGKRSPWLAFIGRHDGSGAASTLIFVDQPGNPRYPNQWFLRNDPFAIASFAFMFDELLMLPAGAELAFQYQLIIADGAWDRARIEKALRG